MTRRYELDWLRVLLFALLVPYHVGTGFAVWGTNIYGFANDQLAGEGMNIFLYWSHGWRLPSLFMIAGIGTWFLTNRGSGPRYVGERLLRLLVPALFGAAFVNVFGSYAIARVMGEPPAVPAFWWTWLTEPAPWKVQHPWFLVNLAIYTVLIWPVVALRARIARLALPPQILLLTLLAASAASVVLLKPHAAALNGNGYQFALYLLFFLGGFLIGGSHAVVLDWTGRRAWSLLATAIMLFGFKLALLRRAVSDDVVTGEALSSGGWVPAGLGPPNATLFSSIEAATAWSWCLAAMGLAVRFLARPSPMLTRLNRAVFPVYVLHYPVVIIGLALAAKIASPWWIESVVLVFFVYGVTWFLWRLADRLGPVAYLVGGRPAGNVKGVQSTTSLRGEAGSGSRMSSIEAMQNR